MGYLTSPCLGIQAFPVSTFGDREGNVDVHLDELALFEQLAGELSNDNGVV